MIEYLKVNKPRAVLILGVMQKSLAEFKAAEDGEFARKYPQLIQQHEEIISELQTTLKGIEGADIYSTDVGF